MDVFKKTSEEKLKELFGLLDEIDPDKVAVDDITIRAGGKLLKFELVSEETLPYEDEIRKEFKEKMSKKIQIIRDDVNKKILEMSEFVNKIKQSYERKETALRQKERRMVSMPNVNYQHAERGLSVVKGNQGGELVWLVRGVYWPKTIDSKPLEPRYTKKLMSPVVFLIKTLNSDIIEVSTRKPIGLNYFDHYHQSNPDCWGKWNYARTWNHPDDILRIAREAEAVLENINTHSIATQNPRGLPRKSTIIRHIVKDDTDEKKMKMGILNQVSRRSGITTNIRENDNNIWTT